MDSPSCKRRLYVKESVPRKQRYPGDIALEKCLTPKSCREAISVYKRALFAERRKTHNLQMKLYRQNKKIATMKSLLGKLKVDDLISENAHEQIHKVIFILFYILLLAYVTILS